MYWQKRFDRVGPNKELEKHILDLHNEHKDFGYRRIPPNLSIMKLMEKVELRSRSYTSIRSLICLTVKY